VNPVVAVVLGALVGGEEVGARVLAAACVIVVAVVIVVRERR
jgi:drug/metabolite transporter (DMT)-like permease